MARKPKAPGNPIAGGGPLRPAAAVILYNRRTGAILNTHYFSAVHGARLPERAELERIAMAQAARDGSEIRMHLALHVDPAALQRGVAYRVSPAKRMLAAVKAGRQKPRSLGVVSRGHPVKAS
jgi:hypothetical protein